MTSSSAAPASPHSARSSALIAAGIFLSRLLGLARQSLIARYLGVGLVSDAFNGAFRLTNFLQNLFGEGALSASFIPVYARALERGDEAEADRIASAIAALLALATSIIVLLGILGAEFVVELFVGGFQGERRALAVRLTRILFPGAGLFVLGAWCLGILNSHRRFFLSYVAPVFWNLAMLAALVVYGGRRGEVDLAVILGWASVLGALLQMGVQLPTVFGLLKDFKPRLDVSFAPVREVVRNFIPAFLARGVVQISTIIDMRLASSIAADGVVTLMQNASTIYLLPISLFGMAVSAAELPEMARESGTGDDAAVFQKLRQRLNAALPRVAYFVVPSAIAFLVVGQSITDVLLRHGKFTADDSMRTWAILAGSAVGLLASSLGRLYSSTLYALKDTRTPLNYALVRLLLTGILGYLFAFPVPRMLGLPAWSGAVGLTLSGGLAGWVEFALLRRAITRRIGATSIPMRRFALIFLAGAVAAVGGVAVQLALVTAGSMVRGAAVLVVFALVYGVVSLALGVPEANALVSRVRRR